MNTLGFWAKYNSQSDVFHPLVFHMIDVYHVSYQLFEIAFAREFQKKLTREFGLNSVTEAKRLCAFIAGLHDIGKACPAFQGRPSVPIRKKNELSSDGFTFSKHKSVSNIDHAEIGGYALRKIGEIIGANKEFSSIIRAIVASHHGKLRINTSRINSHDMGNVKWDDARRKILMLLIEKAGVVDILPQAKEVTFSFFSVLCGFVSVSDWIGSMDYYFPYIESMTLDEYSDLSRKSASSALDSIGWKSIKPTGGHISFCDMFGFSELRPMQIEIESIAANTNKPGLTIIEAPTGEGKTESAFFESDMHVLKEFSKGAYIALPTQATGDQMFSRTIKFLENRYDSGYLNLHLVHGNAVFNKEYDSLKNNVKNSEGDMQIGANDWFTKSKRGLLSPFAVGTIDQVMLSVLSTRYFFIRLFGAAGKTIILDEIHAYDTYMDTIICHLLKWLGAMGNSVVLLSATLPSEKKAEMINSYTGTKVIDIENKSIRPYPLITHVEGINCQEIPFDADEKRTLYIDWYQHSNLAWDAVQLVDDGGCLAIIMNTVKDAQSLYEEISAVAQDKGIDIRLLHSRFMLGDRQKIQDMVIDDFGKGGKRPTKSILISTQIIEQSLDIDFDAMITDLAPIDLLLQRAGRLHRHKRNRSKRFNHIRPILKIINPILDDCELPTNESLPYVYDKFPTLMTYLVLRNKKSIEIPGELRSLIDGVYSPDLTSIKNDAIRERLIKTRDDEASKHGKSEYNASKFLIPSPDIKLRDLGVVNNIFEDGDTNSNCRLNATTREFSLSINIVCLLEEEGIYKTAFNGFTCNIDKVVNKDDAREILKSSLRVGNRRLVEYLLDNAQQPSSWKKSSFLRDYRFIVFDDGQYIAGDYVLNLSKERGLMIKEKE